MEWRNNGKFAENAAAGIKLTEAYCICDIRCM